jgi:hypothetical protein
VWPAAAVSARRRVGEGDSSGEQAADMALLGCCQIGGVRTVLQHLDTRLYTHTQ